MFKIQIYPFFVRYGYLFLLFCFEVQMFSGDGENLFPQQKKIISEIFRNMSDII